MFQLEDSSATAVTSAKQGWEAIDKAHDVLRGIELLPSPDKIAGYVHILTKSSDGNYIGIFSKGALNGDFVVNLLGN